MKLLRLRIKNLNSFRGEIELDFETAPLNDTSLMAITGPTGAGKTTLLDALCVALYNKTPRLSGVGNQNPGNLLSQGKTEGFAEVLFETKGNRYLAEWRIKRSPKGDFKPEVKLIDADTEDLITDRLSSRGKSRGTSERTVSHTVESILGLDFDAFNRSMMLAQGEFAAFLKAKPEERRKILEATTGIGVYDQLKQVLNRKVDETEQAYNQLVGTFEAIPTVTDEEIGEARNELEGLEANAQSLQDKRREILAEREAEAHRRHLFTQLTDAEARQQELLCQQEGIGQQQSELDLARRAAKLIPERGRFQTEKAELGATQEAFAKANNVLAFAQEEYDEGQKIFAKIDGAYQAILSTRETRMEAYNEARAEGIRAQGQLETVEERGGELQTIEKRIEELLKTVASQDKEKSDLVKNIQEDISFLEDCFLPDDSDQRLNQATAALEKLSGRSEFLNEKLKTEKELRSKIAQLADELRESEEEREKRIVEKGAADTRLAAAQSELKVQQDEGTVETWQAQKRQAAGAHPIAMEFEETQRRLSEEQTELNQMCDGLNSVEAELTALDQELVIQTEVVKRAEEKVKRCTAEKDLARMRNHIVDLREQLHNGQPCPVCGAMEHPWVDKEELEGEKQLELASSRLPEAESELQAENEKSQNLGQGRIRNEENQSNLEGQINDSCKKIESFEKTMDAAQAKWRKAYPQDEISSEWAQGIIDVADESIHKLQEAMNVHTEASNNQKMSSQRLNDQERENQRIKTELDDAESKGQTLGTEIDRLSGEIETLKTEFWGLLTDGFREAVPEDAVKQFAAKIEVVKARKEGLNKRRNQLDQRDTEIEQNAKNLETERERGASVGAEIGRYRAEAGQLLESVREKTGGLTAEAAVSELEAEVAEKTDLREQNESALREKENTVAGAQAKRDNLESHHAECVKKFDGAHCDYLEALENGGFESPEAHGEAFRDESWMRTCEEELTEYEKQLHAIEEEIGRLRPNFADQRFDPEAVERLQDAEGIIDQEIEATNQQIGQLRANIKKLEENVRWREAQSGELEKARQERDRWGHLQECIPHNRLRDFALERMFDLIIRLANRQLEDLTERYELRVKGIDDMAVIDRWNANEERPVETLSGGEAFLTSLALALALSEMSRGRTEHNSLYLDEGFGTLDSQTLGTAISALEGLRLAGRSVVVISHVGELTRRIPVRIAVEKMGNGSSRVQVRGG